MFRGGCWKTSGGRPIGSRLREVLILTRKNGPTTEFYVLYLLLVLDKQDIKSECNTRDRRGAGKRRNGGIGSEGQVRGLWLFRGPAYVSSQRNEVTMSWS